jgi:hypothetical protein
MAMAAAAPTGNFGSPSGSIGMTEGLSEFGGEGRVYIGNN